MTKEDVWYRNQKMIFCTERGIIHCCAHFKKLFKIILVKILCAIFFFRIKATGNGFESEWSKVRNVFCFIFGLQLAFWQQFVIFLWNWQWSTFSKTLYFCWLIQVYCKICRNRTKIGRYRISVSRQDNSKI